jgi:hypothetical protein
LDPGLLTSVGLPNCLVDQNGIEPIDGKVWIVDAADDDVDVL